MIRLSCFCPKTCQVSSYKKCELGRAIQGKSFLDRQSQMGGKESLRERKGKDFTKPIQDRRTNSNTATLCKVGHFQQEFEEVGRKNNLKLVEIKGKHAFCAYYYVRRTYHEMTIIYV